MVVDWNALFEEDGGIFTADPLSRSQIDAVESVLGMRLPADYKDMISAVNGGVPCKRFLPTLFPTSWHPEGFEISGILSLSGREDSVDGEFGSSYLVDEWGYPEIGLVICQTPAAGPDVVMLNYDTLNQWAEPTVSYIDEDRVPRQVANGFLDFVFNLQYAPSS